MRIYTYKIFKPAYTTKSGMIINNVNQIMCVQEYIEESDGGVPATTGMGDGMGSIVFPSGCENGFNTGGPGSTIGSGDIPCSISSTRKRKRKRGKNHILDYHTYIQQQSAQVI